MHDSIRRATAAGLFYKDDKDALERDVAVFLENSQQVEIVSRVYGLVAPHAGYMYSGGVAARAYRQVLDRDFDVVAVIAPSHKIYFDEISVYNGAAYETPLGRIQVDQDMARKLAALHPGIIYSSIGHDIDEHSLEVQLPFLQQVFNDFKLLPIVMGNQDTVNVDILAEALAKLFADEKALIVASSDLSHFHNYDKAKMLDNVVVEHINHFDAEKLGLDLQKGLCEMCGGGPVQAMMKATKKLGAKKSKMLLYRNSGDVTGDHNQVVGYLSAMFYS